ncbi:putative membrane protein [Escherichia coli 1827-70]|nr:putative membrane protein [Escherichia coli 1827-70]
MKIIRLLLLACSITIHFFIVKEHVFKIFNQHAYYFLFAFYVLIVFCFCYFLKDLLLLI